MKPCPICASKLKFHESEPYKFSFTTPYIDCTNARCGFVYRINPGDFHGHGSTGFEIDESKHKEAENALIRLFDVNVTTKIVQTRKIYS